ncbi:MAG: HRDC domain-containing protein [Candidatus Cloacimonetes bacterium]|nr:HRDC domain-containing protein [Candidatus Cloacimonadota bacterium]
MFLFFPKEKKICLRFGTQMLRIFTLEYDPVRKSFDDSVLATFLAGKSVISIEKRFFRQNSKFFWTFAIEYETEKIGGSKDIELETDAQKSLFLALKEWRNELAAEKGVPPYLLFTNNQLKQIAIKQPKTGNELKNIQMISAKKVQEYSETVLQIISENISDEQEPAVPDLCPMA